MRRDAIIATALAFAAAGIAGCGGGSSNSSSTSTGGASSQGATATQTPAPSGATAVRVAKTDLGTILTDGQGRTLYLFEKDKGHKSTCFGPCATGWPPLTTKGAPTATSGGHVAKLGTTTRPGGVQQVTYAGHPLYYFQGDTGPGKTTGEGLKAFGAEWYVLNAAGKKVEKEGS